MTWVRLDDNIFDNPKVVEVSPLAKLLHVAGICYSGQHELDGRLSERIVPRLHLQVGSAQKHVGELITARLWHREPGVYVINDYLDYNPSRAEIEAMRQKRQASGRAGGQASATARARANGQARRSTTQPNNPLTPKSPEADVVDISAHKRHFLPGSGWVEEA